MQKVSSATPNNVDDREENKYIYCLCDQVTFLYYLAEKWISFSSRFCTAEVQGTLQSEG